MFDYLSKNTKIQKTYFVVTVFVFDFLGFWPEKKETFRLFLWQIWNLFFLSLGVFGELHFTFYHRDDFLLALDALCPFATKFVTLNKLIYFLIFRNKFRVLVEKVRIWLFQEKDEANLKNIQQMSAIGALFAFLITLFGTMTSWSYALRPIVNNIFDYANGRNFSNELPFQMEVPDSYRVFPRYPILFAALHYSGFVTVFGYGGTDGVFIGFCGYISACFKLVQQDLKNLLNDIKYITTEEESLIYYEKLKKIVAKHNEVIQLAKEFSSFAAYNTLIHFASAAVVICIGSFLFIVGSGVGLLVYATYSLTVLTQLFVYCLGGNYLLESSSQIQEVVYFSDWHKCDFRIRKMVLLIMIRANKATGVEIPFFQPSLLLYGSILSTSASYIALLKTFF